MLSIAQQPLADPALGRLLEPRTPVHSTAPRAPRSPTVVFDATNMGSPLRLDRSWRVGITSKPEAAAPDFDDSGWALRDAAISFDEVPDEDRPAGAQEGQPHAGPPRGHKRPYVWFRLHVKLTPGHGPVSLLVELPVLQSATMDLAAEESGVDVFANGQRIQPDGPHGDQPLYYQSISRIYDLNLDPNQTDLTLAVRSEYVPRGTAAYTNFFATRKLLLGSREDLDRAIELWRTHGLFERLPRLVNSILLTILGLFLLALYFTQKGHIEYLWLALHELMQAPIGFVELAGSNAHLNHLWFWALNLQLLAISAYLYFEFLIAFLALRRRWYIRVLRFTAPLMAGIAPLLLMVGQGPMIGIALGAVGLGSSVWMLCWLAFIFITLINATLRRNFEAGLLLIPLLLTLVGWIEPFLRSGMGIWAGHTYHSPLTLQAGPVPIHFASIADFTGLFVIVLIIFVRFLRIQRDQERVSNELAAARSVQELLIPLEKVHTPGFLVDSVYTPANEVGGDFFYVRPTSDGGLLLVIGDVAGKGLKAAMNVSMLMGALRSSSERRPTRILESLNRVLTGSESFTTCQAAWFGADGELVLANAGHLPPYLNSQEVTIPGSLPLGVTAQVAYDEIHLYLHPGDRLLLLSDGVVEARRPSGELFGFERVHNLSNQSAFYIADAACAFGQEDDITVVTVRRLEQGVA
jgi:hypothetical protein